MELGPKLGEGAGSEAYAWGDGTVIKLFKEGVDPRLAQHEASVTRAVFESGGPAPEVLDVVEVDGRPGIVFPRYDGQTLLTMVVAGSATPAAAGEIMARLHHELHAPQYEPSIITFRDWALFYITALRQKQVAPDALDQVQRVLLTLPEGGSLCHGDLHADNILMTPSGPRIIDWVSALRANPLVDIARQHLTFTVILIDEGRFAAARREADASFIANYARLADTTADDLLTAIDPYMIVMAAMRMMESGCSGEEQQLLAEYVRTRSAGL
jgi:Ser/Thr protein kinase RdoA (MazF antagonist)